jgi:hypothetical protein
MEPRSSTLIEPNAAGRDLRSGNVRMRNRNELDPRAPDRGLGSLLIGALSAIIVFALVYAFGPWSSRTASNAPAGTTIGQGGTPQAKQAPTTTAPSTGGR